MTIELFRCEPLLARISVRQCAANYRDAHGRLVRGATSREIGLGPCKGCEIGKKNARGWRDPRTAQTVFGSFRFRVEKGLKMLEDRKTPIITVERMTGVKRDLLRARLAKLGHDPRDWPHARTHARARSSKGA